MNWLDNVISFVSPAAGARRAAWRQYLEDQRSYDAGNYDRLNAGWVAYNQSAEQTDRYNRDTIRARARDLERNSDMANSIIGAWHCKIMRLKKDVLSFLIWTQVIYIICSCSLLVKRPKANQNGQ